MPMMKNGWTGGQYSVFRIVFGVYLTIHFAMLLPWGSELFSGEGVLPAANASPLIHLFPNILAISDGPRIVGALLAIAAIASVMLAVGWFDRAAAIVIWYVLACTFGRNPLIANPSLPFVGWLLLAHSMLPPAPYGSIAARRKVDPRWAMPTPIFAVAWIVMAVGYSYSGYTKLMSPSWVDGTAIARVLSNPLARSTILRTLMLQLPPMLLSITTWGSLGLELLFAALALMRRVRPWLWAAMLSMHVGLLVLIDFADLSFGMIVLHLFTFDPAWVPRYEPRRRDLVLYDGSCGLCHRAVRFVVSEDTEAGFSFAPLPTGTDPQTVIVELEDGTSLHRSSAAIYILARLGGVWRAASVILRIVPSRILDAAYDIVARSRYRVFGRTATACPVLPPDLRARFVVESAQI
jgi:predicted DCC family thiol-disulfide oxidoreductase YuxK